jgi:Glutaredoxin-like domain (DUF836)
MTKIVKLILYSKHGCCICDSLLEKLRQVSNPLLELEVRDISQNPDWLAKYEYEVPVLCWWDENQNPALEIILPRLSPRSPLSKLEALLQNLA